MKFKQANTYTIQCIGQAISLKSERNNNCPDLKEKITCGKYKDPRKD